MPPAARRPWPRPRSRSRAARPDRGSAPRDGAPTPASFQPLPAWPPSMSRGPGKRRPLGFRPPGPPDIPEIAAHNCTFPGQETSPVEERGPPRRAAAQPAALTCGRSPPSRCAQPRSQSGLRKGMCSLV
uniref:basic proline-rich protein-like n=1 Tax=Panthera onca TaxID=9690 RepID=UPI002954A479|nr:basic proline-rich protein-like [Panthera onca]